MNTGSQNVCPVPIDIVENYFRDNLGSENNETSLEHVSIDSTLIPNLPELIIKYICQAMNRINADTSPGVDRVTIRVLRHLKTEKCLALLRTAMLIFGYIPNSLKIARTVLIHITIFSVIRRIIERVLDMKLRSYLSLSFHERGFISTPGTHINTSLINGCLQTAKSKKTILLHCILRCN
ncbi:hypothetical protein C0J52_26326 [Blattella germanica]|nr:hypothetical protein C0J52_26326 [Blattella germanica]